MEIRWKQLNNPPADSAKDPLKTAKKNVIKQAALAGFTVAVTLVLVFAMTAAWYTNVVSTGGLNFQAESWGFEGGVVLSEEVIKAAPGDSGVVAMQVNNTGKVASAITVNISKEYMQDTEMQQRIFFYADKSAVVGGETVDRLYLNNAGGYTYYLPAQNALVLSQEVYTDVQLKWEWVYDVAGYYFRGTHDGTAFTVEEYLRPVEYDVDLAQYDAETGQLLKTDAQTDVAVFLAELTKKDGFAGSFDAEVNAETGAATLTRDGQPVEMTLNCYPVDEENNIWIYLCSKQDIQSNTAWDTQYGMAAEGEQKTFQVRITVTGQQFKQQTLQVADVAALQDAFNSNGDQIIQLNQDMVLNNPLTLETGNHAVLDLNGHQLVYNGETAFNVATGAQLTVMDGSIVGDKDKTFVFRTVGGQLTMSNLQISQVYSVLSIDDDKTKNSAGDNSVVRITDCTLEAEDVAIYVHGDGTASQRKSALLIQNSTIDSGYIAIMGNGTATGKGRWGTDTQIVNSTVHGLYAGIYQPQKLSNTTVKSSTISGWTGIAVKGGDITVLDSTVIGVGTDSEVSVPTENNVSNSGFVDSGDGIYAEFTYGYPISITVSGSSVVQRTASTARAVRVFPAADNVRVEIAAGTFDTDVSEFLAPGYVCTRTEDVYTVTPTQS